MGYFPGQSGINLLVNTSILQLKNSWKTYQFVLHFHDTLPNWTNHATCWYQWFCCVPAQDSSCLCYSSLQHVYKFSLCNYTCRFPLPPFLSLQWFVRLCPSSFPVWIIFMHVGLHRGGNHRGNVILFSELTIWGQDLPSTRPSLKVMVISYDKTTISGPGVTAKWPWQWWN